MPARKNRPTKFGRVPANQPVHKHDCDKCVFLGRHRDVARRNDRRYDLYYCPSDFGGAPTVLARFGEDGEYYSGMFGNVESLDQAMRRAADRGLDLTQPF